MRSREKILLWVAGLGIPALAAGIVFLAAHGAGLKGAARECERALRLDLPLPESCPPVTARLAPDDEEPAHQAPLTPEIPCYESQRGPGRRWPAPEPAKRVSRPAPEGRGRPPAIHPVPGARREAKAGPHPGAPYVVCEGDTFLEIVRAAYGSTDRWPEVWFANVELVRDGTFLDPGSELTLPE